LSTFADLEVGRPTRLFGVFGDGKLQRDF